MQAPATVDACSCMISRSRSRFDRGDCTTGCFPTLSWSRIPPGRTAHRYKRRWPSGLQTARKRVIDKTQLIDFDGVART